MVRLGVLYTPNLGSNPSLKTKIKYGGRTREYSSSWNVERRSSATHNIACRRLEETDKIYPL